MYCGSGVEPQVMVQYPRLGNQHICESGHASSPDSHALHLEIMSQRVKVDEWTAGQTEVDGHSAEHSHQQHGR